MSTIDALVERVAKDPEDTKARLILADAWLEKGDPRGELTQVQVALASADADKRAGLEKRETELVRQIRDTLVGDVAGVDVRFKLGFLDEIVVDPRTSGLAPVAQRASAVAALARSEHAQLLRGVVFATPPANDDQSIARLLEALSTEDLPAITRVTFGEAFVHDRGDRVFGYFEVSFSDDLTRALAVFPHAKELTIDLGMATVRVPPLVSTTLERFSWVSPTVHRAEIAPLASSKAPALEHFTLWCGSMLLVNTVEDLEENDYDDEEGFEDEDDLADDEEYDEERIDVAALAPVLRALEASRLRELGIRRFRGDVGELVRSLAERPYLANLERLDLAGATFDKKSARALLSALKESKLKTLVATLPVASKGAFEVIDDPLRAHDTFRYVVTQE